MVRLTKKLRLRPTLQVSHTECGLCCVRTLLAAYGHEISITALRQIKEPGRDGLGLQQMRDLLSSFGMKASTYRVKDPRGLLTIPAPYIAFWRGNHFVAVEHVSESTVTIMDPAVGRLSIRFEEFAESFDTYILVANPTATFKKTKLSFFEKWHKTFLWTDASLRLYVLMTVVSLLLVGITLAIPIATQSLVDYRTNQGFSLNVFLLSLGVAVVCTTLLNFARTEIAIRMTQTLSWHLSSHAFSRLLSLPSRYFTVRAPGEIVYRLNSLNRLPDILGTTLIQGALDALSVITVIGYVLWISPVLGTITLLLISLLIVFLGTTQPHANRAMESELHSGTSAQSIQLDAVVSINNVKLGGYVETYLNDWKKSFTKLLTALGKRIRVQQGIIGATLASAQMFSPLFLLVISLKFAENGVITLGEAIAVQSVAVLLFSYIRSLFSAWTEFQVASRYVELAEDIFEYPSEVNSGSIKHSLRGGLTARNLNFKYSTDAPFALNGVNLEVMPGETVALVGASGSGKTTLGKVFATLFAPTSGELLFDGVNVSNYDLSELRKYISYIPQEAYLHNRTIIENLKLGCDLPENDIILRCRELKFLDFIDEFPMGYQTGVSELGANLSGGQRQRIHVARVMLQNPAVLVMDEATSALDNITQRLVYTQLSSINCTKIVIAHRMATILNADRIGLLDGGHLTQVGTHAELMQNCKRYADLYSLELQGNHDR